MASKLFIVDKDGTPLAGSALFTRTDGADQVDVPAAGIDISSYLVDSVVSVLIKSPGFYNFQTTPEAFGNYAVFEVELTKEPNIFGKIVLGAGIAAGIMLLSNIKYK